MDDNTFDYVGFDEDELAASLAESERIAADYVGFDVEKKKDKKDGTQGMEYDPTAVSIEELQKLRDELLSSYSYGNDNNGYSR